MNRSITSFRQIQDYLLKIPFKKILIVLDIDNTLIRPPSGIGSPEWVKWQEDLIRSSKGFNLLCIARTIPELYQKYQNWMLKMRPGVSLMDSEAPSFLQKWSNKGHKIILLTARSTSLSDLTYEQFISHYNPSVLCRDVEFSDTTVIMKQGQCYASGVDKGRCLKRILEIYAEKYNYVPNHIIFVDDSMNECNNVSRILGQNTLTGTVFHFNPPARFQEDFDRMNKEWLTREWKIFEEKFMNRS